MLTHLKETCVAQLLCHLRKGLTHWVCFSFFLRFLDEPECVTCEIHHKKKSDFFPIFVIFQPNFETPQLTKPLSIKDK